MRCNLTQRNEVFEAHKRYNTKRVFAGPEAQRLASHTDRHPPGKLADMAAVN